MTRIRNWVALAALLSAGASQAAEPDWKSLAHSDIEFAYSEYRDNHPGWIDPTNPDFRAQLEMARKEGLAAAEKATNNGGYAAALAAFNAVMNDGHARIYLYPAKAGGGTERYRLWPGFLLAWRGNQAVVFDGGKSVGLEPGSIASSCDGKPFRALVRSRGATLQMRAGEPGHWWRSVPAVLTHWSDQPVPANSCRFIRPDGRTIDITLDWRKAPDSLPDRMMAASDGEHIPIGLSRRGDGIYWISLQTFEPDEAQRADYAKLYRDVALQRDRLKSARAIVLDLRFNDGGSSDWSLDLAKQLWGKESAERRTADYFAQASVWYRVSPGNVGYYKALMVERKDQKDLVEYLEKLTAKMDRAVAAKEPFYVERDDPAQLAAAQSKSPLTDITAPVYVVVPGRCASACLDALDVFTRYPVTLVGAPSASDTIYMDVRGSKLPSGFGQVIIPTKFWHGRPRDSGESYQPAIRNDGLDWSTGAFVNIVEKDLVQPTAKP